MEEKKVEPVKKDELIEETSKSNGHLSEGKDFLGWKKTSLSLLAAKGKHKDGSKFLKKKSLLKKLWKVYKKSNQYADLSLD